MYFHIEQVNDLYYITVLATLDCVDCFTDQDYDQIFSYLPDVAEVTECLYESETPIDETALISKGWMKHDKAVNMMNWFKEEGYLSNDDFKDEDDD